MMVHDRGSEARKILQVVIVRPETLDFMSHLIGIWARRTVNDEEGSDGLHRKGYMPVSVVLYELHLIHLRNI